MKGQQAVNLLVDFSIGQSNFHKYYISVSQTLTQKDKKYIEIMEKFICKYCGKQCKNHSALISHETFCKLNPNLDDKYKPYEYKSVCQKCGKEFIKVYKNISDFGVYKRKGKLSKFCCRSCANTRVISEETKEKIKRGRKIFDELHPNYWQEIQGKFTKTGKFQQRVCKECGKPYVCISRIFFARYIRYRQQRSHHVSIQFAVFIRHVLQLYVVQFIFFRSC